MAKRAENNGPKSEVAQVRKDLYANAYEQIKHAKEAKCYLEVITLCESIICDRLEARIAWIKQKTSNTIGANITTKRTAEFNTIGQNIKEITNKLKETDKDILNTCKEIKEWAKKRNKALHEMVKLEDSNHELWEAKYEKKDIAQEGINLSRKISNNVKKVNKMPKQIKTAKN